MADLLDDFRQSIVADKGFLPDVVKNFLLFDDAPGVSYKKKQNIEGSWREGEVLSVFLDAKILAFNRYVVKAIKGLVGKHKKIRNSEKSQQRHRNVMDSSLQEQSP